MKKRPHPPIEDGYKHHMNIYYPPLLPMPDIPVCLHYGTYLAKRRQSIHTGVDLYTKPESKVYAVEDGDVILIRKFTGKSIGQDWWNETEAVDVEGYTGCITYGEIRPNPDLKVGDQINKGDFIGWVIPVLKEDRGKAMSMLHFAIHNHGYGEMEKVMKNPDLESFYDLQIDPRMLLIQLKNKADMMMLDLELSPRRMSW